MTEQKKSDWELMMDAFEEVTGTYSSTANRRHAKGGTVNKTGLTPLNVNGSKLLRQVIQDSKLDPDTCEVYLRANPFTRVVAVQVVSPGTPNSNSFRRDPAKKTYTLYLHTVFEQYPDLRPVEKTRVPVSRATVKGKDCFLISLKGVATRTGKRDDEKDSNAQSQAQAQSQPKAQKQSKSQSQSQPQKETASD